MHFYYNPVSEEIRKMCWNQGDWRFYKYYREWQWKTYLLAKDICKEEKIYVLHQLNMIGFREPGYLWKLSKETNIPFVWGAVDAKDKFPVAYLGGASMKTKLFMRLKNFLTVWQLKHSTRVRQAASQASVIFSASSNSKESFYTYMAIDSPLLNETGCYVQEHPLIDKSQKETFDVLWVGKLDFRKQLGIALQSVAITGNENIRLHIVGDGDAVNEKVGKKILLSNPSKSSQSFATILNELEGNRDLLKQMSENCKQRQIELSWDEKAKTMVGWYEKIVKA